MENVGRTRRAGERTFTYNPLVQDFVPSSGWTEDSNGHYLLVDLPGFKKEEVNLQVDTSGNMTVSGERLRSDNKHITRFKQIFTTPPDSDIDKISGKFDGELLYVTVPKRAKEETKLPVADAQIHNDNMNGIAEDNKQETGHPGEENVVNKEKEEKGSDNGDANQSENKEKRENDSRIDSFSEDFIRKWGQEPSQFQRVIRTLHRNKGIVITALLAFSLGVLVTRKFGSAGHGEAV